MAANILKDKLDPDNELQDRKINGGHDIECTYKGKKVSYDDYLDIYEERGERIQKGKKPRSIGIFSGWGEGKLRKPYE